MRVTWKKAVLIFVVSVVMLIVICPLVFMSLGSLMDAGEINKYYGVVFDGGISNGVNTQPQYAKPHFFPDRITLNQYYQTIFRTPDFWTNFWNSFILSFPILLGVLIVAPLCGYGLAKFNFRGKKVLLLFYLIVMMLPYQVTLVPNFIVLNSLHLIGSRLAIVLPNIFTTFGCYLMYQYSLKIPDDTIEYARLEGLNEFQIYIHVVLPQMKTGLCSLALLNLIDSCSMVEQPLVLLQEAAKQPLSVSLSYINQSNISVAFVSSVIFIFPLILIFLLGKDRLVLGISESVI